MCNKEVLSFLGEVHELDYLCRHCLLDRELSTFSLYSNSNFSLILRQWREITEPWDGVTNLTKIIISFNACTIP